MSDRDTSHLILELQDARAELDRMRVRDIRAQALLDQYTALADEGAELVSAMGEALRNLAEAVERHRQACGGIPSRRADSDLWSAVEGLRSAGWLGVRDEK